MENILNNYRPLVELYQKAHSFTEVPGFLNYNKVVGGNHKLGTYYWFAIKAAMYGRVG